MSRQNYIEFASGITVNIVQHFGEQKQKAKKRPECLSAILGSGFIKNNTNGCVYHRKVHYPPYFKVTCLTQNTETQHLNDNNSQWTAFFPVRVLRPN